MKALMKFKTPLYFLEPLIVGLGVLGYLAIAFFGLILGAILWPYTLNTWLEFFDKAPQVVWWHGVLLALFPPTGRIMIGAAVITWVMFLFIA